MNVRRVRITTDGDGAATEDVRVPGEILGIFVDIGDLSTPDVLITDVLSGKTILTLTGLNASTAYRPNALAQTTAGADIAAAAGPPVVNNHYLPVICYGAARIALSGAGTTKTGTVYIAFRG